MTYTREALGYPIRAELTYLGDCLLVHISGGVSPHIGSVSTVYFDDGKTELKTLLLPHQRDDVVSERFAVEFSKRTRSTVTAVCGIHYDNPGREGIAAIVECTDGILEDMLRDLSTQLNN